MRAITCYKVIDVVREVNLENGIGAFKMDSFKLLDINNDIFETAVIYKGELLNGLNLKIKIRVIFFATNVVKD